MSQNVVSDIVECLSVSCLTVLLTKDMSERHKSRMDVSGLYLKNSYMSQCVMFHCEIEQSEDMQMVTASKEDDVNSFFQSNGLNKNGNRWYTDLFLNSKFKPA